MYPLNVSLSCFTKMTVLRENKPKIYFYLFNIVSDFLNNGSAKKRFKKISGFKFTIVKDKSGRMKHFHIDFLLSMDNLRTFVSDEGLLYNRMENYFNFESDIEFCEMVLYFIIKKYQFPYQLVSDKIYADNINSVVTSVGDSYVKYIYFGLKT